MSSEKENVVPVAEIQDEYLSGMLGRKLTVSFSLWGKRYDDKEDRRHGMYGSCPHKELEDVRIIIYLFQYPAEGEREAHTSLGVYVRCNREVEAGGWGSAEAMRHTLRLFDAIDKIGGKFYDKYGMYPPLQARLTEIFRILGVKYCMRYDKKNANGETYTDTSAISWLINRIMQRIEEECEAKGYPVRS